MTSKTNWWQPPTETIEAIASVLSSHWAAAKSLQPTTLWNKPATWLRRQANRLVDGATPIVEPEPTVTRVDP